MTLLVRNVAFTFVVPGTGAVLIPWWILRRHPASATAWPAIGVIAAGVALYAWCVAVFAGTGGGTPGPWDPPRRLVAVGPYRWVRNPIYIGALAVILGEAWLFRSTALLVYAGEAAVTCHLFVVGYEERTLRRRFGPAYEEYRRTVPRWIPRRPSRTA
jgi:protein-S-isoprenylcysteine O-methyltransferase Ste14